MFSETHDLADQMPGVSSNVETFRQSAYFTGANHGTSHWITGAISTDTHYYGGQNLGSGTYYAWDRCGSFGASQQGAGLAASNEDAQTKTSPIPWAVPSAVLSSDDLSEFDIDSAVDVTGQSLSANSATGWSLSEADALEAAAKQIDVTSESHAYQARVVRFPGETARLAWIVTTPGGTIPFDGPEGGPVVGAPRLTGVILDPSTGEFWRGFIH
jgi:hypothetical protein